MRSLSESEGRSRGPSHYLAAPEPEGRSRAPSDYWVGPEPSYVHAMSTTPEHGTERMVSFHPSERDMDDTVSGSIARSRRSEDLLMDLEPELVRGATMGNVLRRFGKEWRVLKKHESVPTRPGLSRQTKRYDFFFSHDWRTPGWMKYLSLIIYFNGRAAAIATFIVSVGLGVLLGFEILPRGERWIGFCHLVGLFFLLFWQHLRELLYPQMGFLDRLVVPQDPEKKNKCIYGLASFLNKSDKLIVLWSPKYFSRLWCTYEIACFLMRRKQADRIQFLPVQESILWVLVYLAVSTNWATFYVLQRYDFFHWSDVSGVIGIALVIALQALVIYPPLFWIMNQILYDISLLPEQLRDFNIEEAKCYCCSNGHRLSSTGELIQCDRELIYGVLQLWSGSADLDEGNVEQIQRVFKNHLERHLVKSMEKTFTQSSFLLRPLMSAVAMASFAYLSDFLAYEFKQLFLHPGWEPPIRKSGLVIYVLAWSPIWARMVLMLGNCGKSCWSRRCCRPFLVLVQGVFMFIIGVVFIVFYIVLNGTAPYNWSHPVDAYPLFYLAFTVLVSCFLLRHLCSCRKSAMIGGIPKRSEPREELHFENAVEGEAEEEETEAEDDGSEFMQIKTIVSEDSYFGI